MFSGPIEQFQRDNNFRRMDGDPTVHGDGSDAKRFGTPTVYYYPSDLETAYDSGHLIEFTVFHKSTDGVQEKLDTLKTKGDRGTSLSEIKTAALKEIEADTKDGQGVGIMRHKHLSK